MGTKQTNLGFTYICFVVDFYIFFVLFAAEQTEGKLTENKMLCTTHSILLLNT